jgi:hypothetical protein
VIGTKATGTMWLVRFRHRPVEPKADGEPYVHGETNIVSADPTGRDVYELARDAALGAKSRPELEFSLMAVHRGPELTGTVTTLAATRTN